MDKRKLPSPLPIMKASTGTRPICRWLSISIICFIGLYILLSRLLSLPPSLQLSALVFPPRRDTTTTKTRPSWSTASDGKPFPRLIEASIEDLAYGLESGLFTSVDLVNTYIARIKEVNPILKAVTEINPDALAIAAALDDARSSGTIRGPLHGIPILIKNNIATADKMNNTAGSYALLGAKVGEDSTIAAKLRRAGAIILGKSNLSQWANYRSYNSSNGWSAHGGQVEGAYYPQQDASGSSSGSGVASSLGLAAATIGTETDGSIISPSTYNNIVGIKPSVGLTSRYLVVPISEHQDTIGPMAGSVKDAAYILSAIAGKDPNDNYTSATPFSKMPNYVSACDPSALKGKRIGVPRNLILTNHEYAPIITQFNAALDTLRSAGATVIDNLTLPGYELSPVDRHESKVIRIDFVANVKTYFSKLTVNPSNITSLVSMRDFTQSFPKESYPERNTLLWEAALNLTHDGTEPLAAELWGNYSAQVHFAGQLGITGALKNYSLDALVVPSEFMSSLPAQLGSPVISVPLGRYPADTRVVRNPFGNLVRRAPNVPFGISFLAERFSEEKLIGLAYAFERRTMVRESVVPYVQPMTELAHVVAMREERERERAREL